MASFTTREIVELHADPKAGALSGLSATSVNGTPYVH